MSVEFAIFHESTDGECFNCDEPYDIHLVGAFVEEAWTCPACVDLEYPGMGEVIHGLNQVWNGVSLDMCTRRTPTADYSTVTYALRQLADIVDGIANNTVTLQLSVQLVEAFDPDVQGDPVGISVERRLVNKTVKEIR